MHRAQMLACRALNVLREHGNHLITLFYLMLSCGIPELRQASDINWLRQKLMVRSWSCLRAFLLGFLVFFLWCSVFTVACSSAPCHARRSSRAVPSVDS